MNVVKKAPMTAAEIRQRLIDQRKLKPGVYPTQDLVCKRCETVFQLLADWRPESVCANCSMRKREPVKINGV